MSKHALRSPRNHRFGIWEREVHRRAFLAVGGCTAVATLAATTGGPNLLFARDRTPSSDALEQRIADVIAAFDAQGNHRTGTPVDNASAEWLARQVQQLGAEPELEPFALSRVDPQSCHLRIADRRIDGVPYSTLTSPTGKECAVGLDLSVAMPRSGWQKPCRLRSRILSEGRPGSRKCGRAATRRSSCSPVAVNPDSSCSTPDRSRSQSVRPPASLEHRKRVAEGAGPAARRGDARCSRKPDGRASLQRHRQNRRQQPGAGAARLHGTAQWLVAMRERAGEPTCVLAGSDRGPGDWQAGARLLLRCLERSRARISRD